MAILLLPGHSLDADGLRAHLAGLIASFKVPEHVWFRDESLPRNANGKFVKRQLREDLVGTPTAV